MLIEKIKRISELRDGEIDTMFRLMHTYYHNISKEKFIIDLKEKDGTLLVYSPDNTLQGFSTYMIINTVYNNDKITILFSGDTIVNRDYWGKIAQFRVFGKLLMSIIREYENKKYWLLISKGYRTYLILAMFFKKYYPNYIDMIPEYEMGLLKHLMDLKFPSYSFEEAGVIKLNTRADYLKEQYSCIPQNRINNPDVRFFLEKNPGYTSGEELVCLAEINTDNFCKYLSKFIEDKTIKSGT